ncbi:STY4526/YPO1902 family pathogenicity island replication protein, partial [Shewanella sairae]|uniref:STY4526/YPO1902 family pathogenicity island replication protein n=1 Tax=Shewanella sairae TaxID=190310 RepID=UPI001C822A44
YAKYGQLHELQQLGMTMDQVAMLNTLTIGELELFSAELGNELIAINSAYFIQQLTRLKIPPMCVDFLTHGASNGVMKELFKVSDHTCADWRRFIETSEQFKQRSIPTTCYQAIWDDIELLPQPLKPTAEELLTLAKAHKVGIGAIWSDIKKGK